MAVTIGVESKDVFVGGIRTSFQHLYVVKTVTDSDGDVVDERVIRGGAADNLTLETLADVALSRSPDARGSDTPAERHRNLLDLDGRDPEEVWDLMVQHARNIDRANLPYGPGPFGIADSDEVNSNTTVASVLHAAGFSLSEDFPVGISRRQAPLYSRLDEMDVNDRLVGGSTTDVILGGVGRDRLDGLGGNDRLSGEDGGDVLIGRGGNDTLRGGSGDDLLLGGAGRDVLSGGSGEDRFDFNIAGETRAGSARDVISSFEHGIDRIDLSSIDADRDGGSGNQAFDWIGSNDFSGRDGQVRFENGLLQGDTNGDRIADFEIRVIGTVTAGDVIL